MQLIESMKRSRLRRRAGLGPRGRLFGIGLSRTGTTSLTRALGLLGFRAAHFPADPATQEAVIDCVERDCPRLELEILETVDAITDAPAAARFEALDAAYPGSRFIHTVRDRETWLGSCRRYWPEEAEPYLREHAAESWADFITRMSYELYGDVAFDAERFAIAYDRHAMRVRRHFRDRPEAVLTLDITAGDGWAPLCGFLGLPAPPEPFPWENAVRSSGRVPRES
jgi:hypothetical protein